MHPTLETWKYGPAQHTGRNALRGHYSNHRLQLLAKYGNEEQKKTWLRPLMDGKIRSAYVMTEIDVAASDAKNLALDMRREGNEYVLNGVVSSAVPYPRCSHDN